MNGPAHYREAEQLLTWLDDNYRPTYAEILAKAQVHATLALVAAVATLDAYAAGVSGAATGREPKDAEAWREALS